MSMSGAASTSSAGAGECLAVDDRDDAADNSRLDAVSSRIEPRVEAILRAQRFGELRVANIDPDNAPAAESMLQQIVGVFGLVAAVKRADADMRHARLQRRPVVGGPLHGSGSGRAGSPTCQRSAVADRVEQDCSLEKHYRWLLAQRGTALRAASPRQGSKLIATARCMATRQSPAACRCAGFAASHTGNSR